MKIQQREILDCYASISITEEQYDNYKEEEEKSELEDIEMIVIM